MALRTIKNFEVKYLQILDEDGRFDASLMDEPPDAVVREFFSKIILARTFNSRALSLQREGRIGTYASIFGQEASQIGTALTFEKDDWIFPTFRESGVYVALGHPISALFNYWKGDERGMSPPQGLNIFPMSIPVGTQIPHIAGAAMALRIKGADAAAAGYFGDGGTSKGDFHEGLNFAGVYNLPAVFLCQNNQFAISIPRTQQTAAETMAQKAIAYGFEGVQVDGNDVFAVYKATRDALEKARSGRGPTLIECFTYRLDDHTTADDASRYRDESEVAAWQGREPLIRLRAYMKGRGLWSEEYERQVTGEAERTVDAAIEEAESAAPPEPADMVRHTYGELTPRQINELEELGWRR
ncbi:MAG TPA: pyruvate dehydrogenase (acetyl-transferring) E1 component subunit alpha [Deltaproteobacteria bacterium]|nr:pyruvate dehydrogenase (acetyl-transferring) E1 component subunit alpha [Deltaproteobacteria bacterium]